MFRYIFIILTVWIVWPVNDGLWAQAGHIPENTFWNNGRKKDEFIKLSKYALFVKVYDSTGNLLSESRYRNGIPHGTWKAYYPGGKIKFIHKYFFGKENGLFIDYDENEHIKLSSRYRFGEKHGREKEYDSLGNLVRKSRYGITTYLKPRFASAIPREISSEDIFRQENYGKRSTKIGKEYWYYPNGKLKQIKEFDNLFYILEYDFYPLKSNDHTEQMEYRSSVVSVKSGKWLFFNETGKIYRMEVYDKDNLVEIVEF